jgi:adenylosuccinate lyase
MSTPLETLVPFSSLLFRDVVGTPEMRAVWTEENTVGKWIQVHRAIVEAQRELGLLEATTAAAILAKLSLEHLGIEHIHRKQQTHSHLMVSFLKAFREVCGPAAEHFYVGPTTQDVLDTALTLQIAEAHTIVLGRTAALEEVLCARALEYRDAVVMGRSHQQHTVPTTFGFILATWASEISDHGERALESEKRWLLGNLSGISGAQNAFVELADAKIARRLQELVCARLKLAVPSIDLHTRSDRFAEVVGHLAELASSLGKIGTNLVAWQRSEVGEVEAPSTDEQYSSSTSPNKVNPESSEHAAGLAMLVRGLSTALLGLQMLDNRDGTRLPVELVAIPLTYLMTSRALATTTHNLAELQVHTDAMRANLEHPNVLGQAAAERIMIALYKKTGKRDWAHTALHRCARRSREERLPFVDAVLADPEIAEHLDRSELTALSDLSGYTGTAAQQTVETVQHLRSRRQPEPGTE